jgi:hypothetical protein
VVQGAFSEKVIAEELNDLSFTDLVDIMWAQSSSMNQLRITDHIIVALDDPLHNKPLDSMIKILDKLAQNEFHVMRNVILFEKLSKAVLRHKDLADIAVPIKARFLRKFAMIQATTQSLNANDLI